MGGGFAIREYPLPWQLRILRRVLSEMRVISRRRLVEAAVTHADSAPALDAWYRITKKAIWKHLADVRRTFSTADVYGSCTIFNIKGNNYRLIVWINYETQKVFTKHFLTHADYNKGGLER